MKRPRGHHRKGARHYSTVLGRFLQREPMTLVGLPNPANPLGVNAYLYSHNSPTTMSDISGLDIGVSSTSSQKLYQPEKPEGMPYEPLPDPDPGFEAPGDFLNKAGMMEFRIPGWVRPPWDRRNPDIPLPPNPWGWTTMSMPAPVDPRPGATPLGPPPAPGTPAPVPHNLTGPQCMGASSSPGPDVTSGPGWQAPEGKSGQHLETPESYAMDNFTGTSSYSKNDFNRDQARHNAAQAAEMAALGSPEQRLANAIAGGAQAKADLAMANAWVLGWGITSAVLGVLAVVGIAAIAAPVAIATAATAAYVWAATRIASIITAIVLFTNMPKSGFFSITGRLGVFFSNKPGHVGIIQIFNARSRFAVESHQWWQGKEAGWAWPHLHIPWIEGHVPWQTTQWWNWPYYHQTAHDVLTGSLIYRNRD